MNPKMADCSNDIDGGLTNNGYIDDHLHGPTLSHVPTAPHEKLGVPVSGLPNHSAPCPGPVGSFVNCSSQLPPKESSSDREHDPTDGKGESLPGPCGYCCWMPSCLQRVASGRFFVVFLAFLSLTEAGLTVGYISSMVTSFELQFRFSSTLTGFVVSCYDIGTLVVILTSYFGGRAAANRPKWIAWSAWSMTLGSCIVTLPHFFISYNTKGNDTVPAVCHPNEPVYSESKWDENACEARGDEGIEGSALFFLIPGMLLIGAGSTATLTLGIAYIDDFVRKKETPILLAILFSTTVIGPALGFLVGSFFLKYYVDFDTIDALDVKISPSSPRWVGAWWLGFFFFAGAIMIMAIPVYAFPAKLRKPDEKYKEEEDDDDGNVRMAFSNVSLRKIPLAIWGLLKNPVYMLINVASAAEFSIITGFVRFAPKFIQSQFELKATTANLITGTLIPVAALGVILGGFILNRVKPSLMGSVSVLSACTIISGLLYGLIYIPGPCRNSPMAGVTTPYQFNDSHWHRPSDPYSVNFTRPCNAPCRCDVTKYSPVCSSATGVAYFSPCFAGCDDEQPAPTELDHDSFAYFNCTCVENYNVTSQQMPAADTEWPLNLLGDDEGLVGARNRYRTTPAYVAEATTGLCPSNCEKSVLFLALFLVVVFVSSLEQMPALMSLLRCVKKEERPFALGLQFVILRLFGLIPSPVYYGAVIDSTCILWQKECSGDDGACLQYDNAGFFYRYLGVSTLLKGVSVGIAVLVWIVVRRMHVRGATMSPLPSPPPTTEDSGITSDSAESRKNSGLSEDISAHGRFQYTDEIRAMPDSIGNKKQ